VSLFMYKNLDVNMSMYAVIQPTLVRGVGMAFLMAPIMAAALNSVPHNKAGMASSMLSIIMQVAGSIGIASLATVLANRVHYHLSVIGSAARAGTPAFMETARRVTGHVHGLGYTYGQSKQIATTLIAKKVAQTAMVMSFQDAFIVAGMIVSVAFVLSFFLPNRPVVQHGEATKAEAMEESMIME